MTKRFFLPVELSALLRQLITVHKQVENVDRHFYKYAYILHRLYFSLTAFRSRYDKKGAAINIDVLSSTLGTSNAAASGMLRDLQQWGIIRVISGYTVGKHSRRYKLSSECEQYRVGIMEVSCTDARFIKRLLNRQKGAIDADRIIRTQYDILQKRISLSQEGVDFLKNKYPQLMHEIDKYPGPVDVDYTMGFDPRDIILVSILIRDFFVKRPDQKSRMFSNLTCLKREYRKFLLIDGKPILETDLVNSQILFSVIVVENKIKQFAGKKGFLLPKDFMSYKASSEIGQVYETVAAAAGRDISDEERRAIFKETFFKDVFFSRVTQAWTTPVKDAFYQQYPSVARAIEKIKQNDYRDFAIQLQRMEAGIMIDTVLKRLYKKKIPALSIHDSIVVNCEEHLLLAEEMIRNEFKEQYGLSVTLKRKTRRILLNLDKEYFKKLSAA